MSLRESILAADDLPLVPVEVPEWKCTVYIATLNTHERELLEARHLVDKVRFARERFIIATCCDENRNFLFTEADIEALGKKSAVACDRLFDVAMRVNKLGKDDVDDLKKNSETAQ